jgi:hypothetical protein
MDVSRTQECAEGKCFSDAEAIKSTVKRLTDIPVPDFKNCFEQWPISWEYCKELEGDYFEEF